MYITVDFSMFSDAFRRMGREDQFSREALEAIFEYIENYEEETGENIELDVIAICCDFTEYESIQDAAERCGYDGDMDDESAMREYIEEGHFLIELDNGGIIIQE